jgi:hypothetical protein
MSLHFTIPGEPVAWERVLPRGRGHGKPVIPKATRDHMKTVADYAWLAVRGAKAGLIYPASGYFWLGAAFYLGTYEQKPGDTRNYRRDLDNLLKTVQDACRGILWHDDTQVRGYTPGTKKVEGCPTAATVVFVVHEREIPPETLALWTRLPQRDEFAMEATA